MHRFRQKTSGEWTREIENANLKRMAGLFTKKALDFLKTAGEETSPKWLDQHKKEHKELIVEPMTQLALFLRNKLVLKPEAKGYKFPVRGFGRLRRPKHKVQPGKPAYRNFVHMGASRPSKSLFDENPGLYVYISPVKALAGGGLYEPSSRQIKKVRQWIDHGPADLAKVLKQKSFTKIFPDGFETEKILKTFPRDYGPEHKHIEWLRLQAYYVTRNFKRKDVTSSEFPDLVLESWTQALKLNAVIDEALSDWYQPIAPDEAVDDVTEDDDMGGGGGDLWDDRL